MTTKKKTDEFKPVNNPVAKYGNRINRSAVHRDKTKYTRKGRQNTVFFITPKKKEGLC